MFRITRLFGVLFLIAGVTLSAQVLRKEDAYKSPYNAQNTKTDEDNPENADVRAAAWKELLGGDLDSNFAQQLNQQIQQKRQLSLLSTGPTFVNIGPTNANKFQNGVNETATDSGRLRVILQDPTNANIVYVAVGVGGVWKTTNFFAEKPNWRPLTDDIGTSSGSLAFGRTPNVLYYGTGDPLDWGVGGAMYKSINGTTFGSGVQLGDATDITSIAVDTAGADDVVMVGTTSGLYVSTNSGASYVKTAIPTTPVWSIVRSGGAWLASVQFTTVSAIYRSTDGVNWTIIAILGTNPATGNTGRATLAAGGPNNMTVYAIATQAAVSATPNNQRDLFKSTDGGFTWTGLNVNAKVPTNPNFYNGNMALINPQGTYNQYVVVDPTDGSGNTVFFGGTLSSGISRDGGQTWTLLSSWLGSVKTNLGQPAIQLPYVHADHHTGMVGTDGKGGKVIFLGTDGGIFYSVNDGKNFINTANEGLTTHMIYTMASTPVRPDAVLIGLQDNGTRFRVGQSTTYNGSIGGDGIGTGWSQANNNMAVGTVQFGSVRRWLNPPPNNQSKYDRRPIPGPGQPFFTTAVLPNASLDSTGYKIFSNSNIKLFRSDNAGDVWDTVKDFSATAFRIRQTVHPIGISPTSLTHLGLAGGGGNVAVVNGDGVWNVTQLIGTVPLWQGFNSNVARAGDNQTIYVASEVAIIGLGVPHVAKSTNGGTTWADASGTGANRINVPVQKIVIDPTSANGNHAYAATWIGIYETTDGGQNWVPFGTGLPNCIVSDIYLFPDGKKIRISTYGRGVWEAAL